MKNIRDFGVNAEYYETDFTDSYEDRNKPYVKIKDGITEILSYSFYGCKNLTEANIPNSVKEIGNECFCGCTDLTEIHIPNSVEKIGWDCFKGCTNLKTLIIPAYLDYNRDYLCISDDCELVEY